jgi:hypothetical protein
VPGGKGGTGDLGGCINCAVVIRRLLEGFGWIGLGWQMRRWGWMLVGGFELGGVWEALMMVKGRGK